MLVITLLIISGCLYKSQKQIEEENLLKEVGWNQTKYEEYSDFYVYLANNTDCRYKICRANPENLLFELEEKLDKIPQWENEFEKTWYLVFSNFQKGYKSQSSTNNTIADRYFKNSYEYCQKIAGWNPLAAKAEAIKHKKNKNVLNVGQERTYKTIQSAIDAAKEWDIISVDEGTYFENIVLKKNNILLVGINKNNTIIDGKGSGSVIDMSFAGGVIVSGFTIRNSGRSETDNVGMKFDSSYVNKINAGIKFNSSYSNIITNNIILNNAVGVSIYMSHENIVSGNDLESNNKYGVFILSSNQNEIYNNSIKNNKVGISANGASNNKIHSNNFIGNMEQAYDDSIHNSWSKPRSGNYWSDYNGSSDRYIIPGVNDKYISVSDPFPLSNAFIIKYEPIQISEPTPENICVLFEEVRKKEIWRIGRYG